VKWQHSFLSHLERKYTEENQVRARFEWGFRALEAKRRRTLNCPSILVRYLYISVSSYGGHKEIHLLSVDVSVALCDARMDAGRADQLRDDRETPEGVQFCENARGINRGHRLPSPHLRFI
jgi:hypothetical protein